MNRAEALRVLAEFRTSEAVIMTMSAQKEWPKLSPSSLNFQVTAAMGYASSIGLGVALARPDKRVIVLDGDGSLLMNLGTLVTIASVSPPNMIHFVFENGLYELPGDVPIPGSAQISLCGLARNAGIHKAYEFDNPVDLREHVPTILREPGPTFVSLKVAPGPKEEVTLEMIFRRPRDMAQSFRAELNQ